MDGPFPRNHNTVVPSSATRSRERNIFYRQKMRGQPGRWTVLFPCNHNTYGGAFFSYRLAREKTFSTRRKCGDRWVKQLLEKILGAVNFIMLFLRQTTSAAVFSADKKCFVSSHLSSWARRRLRSAGPTTFSAGRKWFSCAGQADRSRRRGRLAGEKSKFNMLAREKAPPCRKRVSPQQRAAQSPGGFFRQVEIKNNQYLHI